MLQQSSCYKARRMCRRQLWFTVCIGIQVIATFSLGSLLSKICTFQSLITAAIMTCRCPPSVCVQDGNTSCLPGHQGPLCSLCESGFAAQSGRCRECGSLGKWPELIAAALVLVVFVFLFFFSWFPLLPEWVQNRLSFFTNTIEEKATQMAEAGQGGREEFGAEEEEEPKAQAFKAQGDWCSSIVLFITITTN
jgi:hypothetical protein